MAVEEEEEIAWKLVAPKDYTADMVVDSQ